MSAFLRYSDDVEEIADGESETFAAIAETFSGMGEKIAADSGCRRRVSHAKATALLDGELSVEPGLAPELAQGLAATPGRYPVQVRFAQGPGEVLPDAISTHRGMAVRIAGLAGDSIAEAAELGVQDFVLEGTGRAFINSNADTFLANLRAGVSHAPSLSTGVKQLVRNVARGTEAALEAVGLEAKTLGFFGHPPLHPLAEPYFSQAPMRWGDHVAKVGFFPTQATLDGIAALEIDTADDFDAFRGAMIAHFANQPASFELRVQMATDLAAMPVEDATVEWSQDISPYRTVGRLDLPAQEAFEPEHARLFEAKAFAPANSLIAHRPLGQVMRARLFVYQRLAAWRREGMTAIA